MNESNPPLYVITESGLNNQLMGIFNSVLVASRLQRKLVILPLAIRATSTTYSSAKPFDEIYEGSSFADFVLHTFGVTISYSSSFEEISHLPREHYFSVITQCPFDRLLQGIEDWEKQLATVWAESGEDRHRQCMVWLEPFWTGLHVFFLNDISRLYDALVPVTPLQQLVERVKRGMQSLGTPDESGKTYASVHVRLEQDWVEFIKRNDLVMKTMEDYLNACDQILEDKNMPVLLLGGFDGMLLEELKRSFAKRRFRRVYSKADFVESIDFELGAVVDRQLALESTILIGDPLSSMIWSCRLQRINRQLRTIYLTKSHFEIV